MITGRSRFNIYLLVSAMTALAVCGCRTTEPEEKPEEKITATLEIHLEVPVDSMDFSMQVPVYRAKPVMVNVDKAPFIGEGHLAEAKVVESGGTYMIELHMEQRGIWLFQEYTAANPGKHFAIFCRWGPKLQESRWLAAPVIRRGISNGVFAFTPDASREEADQIVLGLNNLIRKVNEKSKW